MSIADNLKAATTAEVEAAGMHWRIRKVNSKLLAMAGTAALAILPVNPEPDAPEPADASARLLAEMKRHPKAIEAVLDQQAAVVAAGVTHASSDGGTTWEPLQVISGVMPRDMPPGCVHVDQLPPGAEAQLFDAVLRLSTDGGAAIARLASFRSAA